MVFIPYLMYPAEQRSVLVVHKKGMMEKIRLLSALRVLSETVTLATPHRRVFTPSTFNHEPASGLPPHISDNTDQQ